MSQNKFKDVPSKVLIYMLSTNITVIASVPVMGAMKRFIDEGFDFHICPDTSILNNARVLDHNGMGFVFTKFAPWDLNDACPQSICVQQVVSVCDAALVPGLAKAYLASLPSQPVLSDAELSSSAPSAG